MGACDFETIALGRDAAAAYDAARAEALYMDGHGGYTGTIAEKAGFVSFGQVPPRWKSDDYVRAIWACGRQRAEAAYEAEDRRMGYAKPKAKRQPLSEWERRDRALLRRAAAAGISLERAGDLAEGDKWGPAVCIEVVGAEAARIKAGRNRKGSRDRVFIFFGLAST